MKPTKEGQALQCLDGSVYTHHAINVGQFAWLPAWPADATGFAEGSEPLGSKLVNINLRFLVRLANRWLDALDASQSFFLKQESSLSLYAAYGRFYIGQEGDSGRIVFGKINDWKEMTDEQQWTMASALRPWLAFLEPIVPTVQKRSVKKKKTINQQQRRLYA